MSNGQSSLAWDKTFPKSGQVMHQKVSFYNRLGILLVADVYVPQGGRSTRFPALIVGHPFGGVKEQTSGLYAQSMAERGFVALAFDASYNVESGGQPRAIASPEAFVEDFSAAVDFLGVHPLVDRERIGVIGVIGVCGSGGFALAAAQVDPRIRAIATVSMVDMGGAFRGGPMGTATEADRRNTLEAVARQRWAEYEGAEKQYFIGTPEAVTEDSPPMAREFDAYYRQPRGSASPRDDGHLADQHRRPDAVFPFRSP